MNLGATRSVVWSIPPEDGAKEIEEYRFTFGSCTMAGSGRYWACLRDFNVWYEEQNGKKLEEALKSKDSEERVEAARLQNLANNYGARAHLTIKRLPVSGTRLKSQPTGIHSQASMMPCHGRQHNRYAMPLMRAIRACGSTKTVMLPKKTGAPTAASSTNRQTASRCGDTRQRGVRGRWHYLS
jgi:hypothetical protein